MHHQSTLGDNAARHLHGHAWLVGVVGLAVGGAILVFVPAIPAVANSILLFAGFHVVGALILLLSAYSLGLRRLVRRHTGARRAAAPGYDFGWGPEWMNGLGLAALATLSVAVAVAVAASAFWPVTILLVLLAANFFIGNLVMRSFRSAGHVVLPMVRLLSGPGDTVLDAGCGSGRTSIALGRVLGEGRIVAVDRFDADYIDDGGRALFDRNLDRAGLGARVTVVKADLTALPFEESSFDAAISTNVFDHLGSGKGQALAEIARVLRPGGRFLMAVWVPSWPMFTVANVLSLFLTSRRQWRDLAARAGLSVVDEGAFNFAWFVLLERPVGVPAVVAP